MAAQTTSWKHSDVVPLIAYVIRGEFQQRQRFVMSREITDAVLRDPEARRITDAVVHQRGGSPKRTAGNMVAWFSQRITAQQSEWQPMFERTRINNQYGIQACSHAKRPNDDASGYR